MGSENRPPANSNCREEVTFSDHPLPTTLIGWSGKVTGKELEERAGGFLSEVRGQWMEGSSEEGVIGFLEFTGVGSGLGKKELKKKAVVIGRWAGDVVVPDGTVSQKHAELVFGKGRWAIRDFGSSNGTFVDGKRVLGEHVPINAKSEVRIGHPGITFRVKVAGKRGRPRKLAVGEKRKQLWRPGVHTITDRDLDVLQWVAEHRFSTAELLVRACFSSPDKKRLGGNAPSGIYGGVRIAKLVRDGFLTASTYRIGKTVPLLLSQKGYNLLHGQGRVEWAQFIPEIGMATFDHECWLQRLRMFFESKHGATKWKSERLLKQHRRDKTFPYVPDARFSAGGHHWVLELERTQKNSARLKELLEIREKANKNTRMIYVMPLAMMESFKNTILKAFVSFPHGLYIVTMEDLETAYCNRALWHPMPVADLLAGKPDPDLLKKEPEREQPKPVARAARQEAEKLPSVLSYYETIRKYFVEASTMLADIRAALIHNQGKLGGMWKPKDLIDLEFPNFPPAIKAFDPLMRKLEGLRMRSEGDADHTKLIDLLHPFHHEFSGWIYRYRDCSMGREPWPLPPEKLKAADDLHKFIVWMEQKIAEKKAAA